MGNENERLNNETKKINKMRKEAMKNNRKIARTIASDDENSDDDENYENKNEKELEEYDKEISKMLFDEEAELDEGERLKKNRKKMDKKAELKSYAQQIAEEQFMEEINRSKSVNKETRRRGNDSDDDSDDDYDAYRRWKERKKKKKKKSEKNNHDEDDRKNIRKIRNVSSDKKQRNVNTEVYKDNDNDNLNINYEIEKKSKKERKKENTKNLAQSTSNNVFSFGLKNKLDENNNKIKNSSSQQNYNTLKTTSINFTPMGIIPTGYYNKLANQKNNTNTPTPENNQNNETPQNYSSPMAPGSLYADPTQFDQTRPKTQYGLGITQNKTAISKNVYSKVKPEDLRIVLLYMKNSNNKYQEGLDLCGQRKYVEAQSCFNYAKSSYLSLNKLMNGNPRAYPIEFTMVISKKINEKLILLHQSIRECNNFIKTKNTEHILRNNGKPQDVLRSINQDMNNQNNNFNFNNNFNNNNNINNINNNNFKNNTNNNSLNKQKSIHDKEEDAMDEKIESEIMVKNPGVRFNDIIGMKEMKQILYEIIVVPTIRPDLFTGIRKPQRGILLFGPPGTGKTMIAKAIASECNSTFFNISASSLTSKWVGESEKTVKSLFKIAYKRAPSIVFIDEIDSILSKRNESENEATKRLKTEFLIQFDGLGSNTNARLLVIAATNRPMDLDDALLRRLPKRVYCGPLDEQGRFEFIKKVINRVETNLSDRDIQEVARMTNGYSNSDLKELCKEAAFQPVRELTMEQILRINKFRPLVKQDLVKAVHKIRGTLSHKIIDELLKWNEQFGGI